MDGTPQPDSMLAFDFTLKVKKGKNPKRPVFTCWYESGPVDDRFVYLPWWSIKRGDHINRQSPPVENRLGDDFEPRDNKIDQSART